MVFFTKGEGEGLSAGKLKYGKYVGILNGMVNNDHKVYIAVCDDMAIHVQRVRQMVENELEVLHIPSYIDVYLHAENLMKSETEYDIIFLDIEMPGKNGLQVAKEYRRKNKTGKIVFMTEYREYMQEAFKVQPFRYLHKEDSSLEIRDCLIEAIKENEYRCGIILEIEEKLEYLFLNKILYIQALGDEVSLFLVDESRYIIQMTLKKAYAILQNRFVRCSRGTIVNLAYIDKVKGATVLLDDGEEIPVSVRERKAVRRKHKEYFIGQMLK